MTLLKTHYNEKLILEIANLNLILKKLQSTKKSVITCEFRRFEVNFPH